MDWIIELQDGGSTAVSLTPKVCSQGYCLADSQSLMAFLTTWTMWKSALLGSSEAIPNWGKWWTSWKAVLHCSAVTVLRDLNSMEKWAERNLISSRKENAEYCIYNRIKAHNNTEWTATK